MMRLAYRLLVPVAAALIGAVSALLGGYVWYITSLPDLEPWHLVELKGEFRAIDEVSTPDLASYLAREARLFAELETELEPRLEPGHHRLVNRYWRGSLLDPSHQARNWNRTFELGTSEPVAGALLLHGLSDSPYSLRAVGQILHAAGVQVVGLRLPGHGTAPSGLLDVAAEDWQAAVRVAARHLLAQVGEGRPLLLVGYSNGAALAVDYTLSALEQEGLPRPAGLVLLSPALRVTPAAAYARYQVLVSRLSGFRKLAWTEIQPEFDPYKYNSFTVNAGAQIHALTAAIEERLAGAASAAGLRNFPPVLAFQSAVDATIPTQAVVEGLLRHLAPGNAHQLVVFDVNHGSEAAPLLRSGQANLTSLLQEHAHSPFSITVLTNVERGAPGIRARTREVDTATIVDQPLALRWPDPIFSLSHVAVPFPPDDPLYGGPEAASADDRRITLGDVTLLGERGVLQIPDGFFLRLRYNPFFPYLEARLRTFLRERLAVPEGPATSCCADP